MKKKILWALIAVPFLMSAQTKEPTYFEKNGKMCLEEVIKVEGATKSELHKRCRAWFSNAFKSSNDVIQLDTEDEIIGKGNMMIVVQNMMPVDIRIGFTLSVKFKEGRYKYEMTNFHTITTQGNYEIENWVTDEKAFKKNGKPKTLHMSYRVQVPKNSNLLLESMKLAMNAEEAESDW